MMQPLVAFVAPAGVNLSPLTSKLWAERLPHRVVQHPKTGEQQLLVSNEAHLARVHFWLAQWQAGELAATPASKPVSRLPAEIYSTIQQTPLTALGLVVLTLVFLAMQLIDFWHSWLATGLDLWPNERNQLGSYLELGFWPLWRPVLLHFGLAHFLFNSLAWFIFASRIERLDGKLAVLLLIILAGLAGNALQWWALGPRFGGASGITFALLGWLGLRIYLKKIDYDFPALMLPLTLGIMLLMLTADTLLPGLTGTAHQAHLGGLMMGLLLGWVWPRPKVKAT